VNRSVTPDTYPDPVARTIANELSNATVARFGAGDSMPAPVLRAWWAAMDELVRDPTTLDSMLTDMTAAAQSAR
jgi:alpha-glucoside transport system substrate-binding protein